MFDMFDLDAGASTTLIGDAARRGRTRAECEALDPRTTLHQQLAQLRLTNAERGRNAGRCCGYLRLVGAWLATAHHPAVAATSTTIAARQCETVAADTEAAVVAIAAPAAGPSLSASIDVSNAQLPTSSSSSFSLSCCGHAAVVAAVGAHITATVDAVVACLGKGPAATSSRSASRASSSVSSSSPSSPSSPGVGDVAFESFEDAAAQLIPMCRLATAATSLVEHCCSPLHAAAAAPPHLRPAMDFLAQCIVDAIQGHLDAVTEAKAAAEATTGAALGASAVVEAVAPSAVLPSVAVTPPPQPVDAASAIALFMRTAIEVAPDVFGEASHPLGMLSAADASSIAASVVAGSGTVCGDGAASQKGGVASTSYRTTPQTAGAPNGEEEGEHGAASASTTTRGARRIVVARRGGAGAAAGGGLEW